LLNIAKISDELYSRCIKLKETVLLQNISFHNGNILFSSLFLSFSLLIALVRLVCGNVIVVMSSIRDQPRSMWGKLCS